MKTLLLCGYRTCTDGETPLGLQRDDSGRTLLDRRIRELQVLGHQVVCVLAGDQADDLLRHCRTILSTELVFDTNGSDVSLMTNIKAGLAVCEKQAVYIQPLELTLPPTEIWEFIKDRYRHYAFERGLNLVQVRDAQGTPLHYGFPLLATRLGGGHLRELPDLKSLADTRLNYLHLIYPAESTLASSANPA
ncbi:MAG: hypothetical protein KF799_03950 [Bdellovibrionales bacterium]|nr:hypothetical protein [Bdellovibrionales bacterium]